MVGYGGVFITCLFVVQDSSQNNILADDLLKRAVILCLGGAEPFLFDCVRILLNQNYPRYDLKLVIDSLEDPAGKIAIDSIQQQQATNVLISPLTIIRKNCNLKCSSIVQTVLQLDNSYQVVALIDADTVVYLNWRRKLVTPLSDRQVGATTGRRWYLLTNVYWGSLVRYIWNVSTVVQMYLFGTPWGGSLAIKTQVLHQTGLLNKRGQADSDTMIRSVLKKYEMQVKFVLSLVMLNREKCNLPSLRY